VSAAQTTVHVRVSDAATGQPTAVRLRLTNAEGEYFPPFGRLARFATGRGQDVGGHLRLGARAHAYIDGTCEVRLPAGTILAEIAKGPEYRPQTIETSLAPGKLALRLSLERWINLRDEGWYSGDTRCHFLTPHAALLEAAAEDLAVVNLLVEPYEVPGPSPEKVPALPNILAFSGQQAALQVPGHLVAVNTHNIHPVLGSLGLLHCHRIVYPLTFGGPDGQDDWTLHDWCHQCHRKGGLVVWTRSARTNDPLALGEPLADLILGEVDAYEVTFFEDSPFDHVPDWYDLLNCGFRVPLAGGSGKDSNAIPLGAMRTYARLLPDESLSYRSWIEAIRAGRTFVTNGPLLSFTVAGQGPGAMIDLASAAETVQARAEARSIIPFERLELVANGRVIAEAAASGSPCRAVLEAEVPVTASGWLAARCRGSQQLLQAPAPQRVFAHTSPVYLRVAGQEPRADPVALKRFVDQLDGMLAWVAREARCPTEKDRQRLAHVFQEAREKLLAKAAKRSVDTNRGP
jgi:hypothetical protein